MTWFELLISKQRGRRRGGEGGEKVAGDIHLEAERTHGTAHVCNLRRRDDVYKCQGKAGRPQVQACCCCCCCSSSSSSCFSTLCTACIHVTSPQSHRPWLGWRNFRGDLVRMSQAPLRHTRRRQQEPFGGGDPQSPHTS